MDILHGDGEAMSTVHPRLRSLKGLVVYSLTATSFRGKEALLRGLGPGADVEVLREGDGHDLRPTFCHEHRKCEHQRVVCATRDEQQDAHVQT